MTALPFLGNCQVCQKPLRNYRALSVHIRWNSDPAHLDLLQRWQAWRAEYRATLRCRKCGDLFEITDKALKDKKRCPKCEDLRQELGKRGYEKNRPIMILDTRQIMKASNSKAQWDGLEDRRVRWVPGDDLYRQVVEGHMVWERVQATMKRLGITFRVYKAICQHALGVVLYEQTVLERKKQIGRQNAARSHELYRALSPEAKAAYIQARAQASRGLEDAMCRDLDLLDHPYIRNKWTSLPVAGEMVPREADMVLTMRNDHKVVILCDGEAFHGPKCVFGDPTAKIASDRATALAFFDRGYSVLRYSESEIHSGAALVHLRKTLKELEAGARVYRNWCPQEECIILS